MICSCVVPSRGRPFALFALIHTLNESGNPDNFEVVIRLDEDDNKTLAYRATFNGFKNVKLVVGKRLGYGGFSTMCQEAVNASSGKWIWFLTDDCVIGGKNFDQQFDKIPPFGRIVQPEISRLGGSTYIKWEGSNYPALPKESLRGIDCSFTDTGLDEYFRLRNGWTTAFLEGITAWHLQ